MEMTRASYHEGQPALTARAKFIPFHIGALLFCYSNAFSIPLELTFRNLRYTPQHLHESKSPGMFLFLET